MLTAFGVLAVTFMVAMYVMEGRDRRYTLAFAGGCLLSGAYGFLAGAWPFGVVEVIWAGVAVNRYLRLRSVAPLMSDRDQRIQARGRELLALASRHFPREFEASGDADAWPLIGNALISRMTTNLEAILTLHPAGHASDGGTLLRSLYEHAVHLAWLGAEPSAERIERWRSYDLRQRLKADDDARQRGIELFTDAQRSQLEAQISGMTGGDLVLADLALVADSHWSGKLPGMGQQDQPQSFRGLYPFVYRHYTAVAHPRYQGLNHVVEDATPGRQRVRLEGRHEGMGPYGLATVVFALALYVAADTLGWPKKGQKVNAIFERYP